MQKAKARLRRQFQHQRSTLSANEHARRSDQIVRRMERLPELTDGSCVHVFWPMVQRKEVDLRPLIAWLYTHKKQIVLPVVVDREGGRDSALEHRRFEGADALVRSRLGIEEPVGCEPVPLSAIDVVIVPALGVDRRGVRLGYGRGHYDRFLKELSVPRICPVFQDCVVEHIEAEPHDIPVNVIVTEDETLRLSKL